MMAEQNLGVFCLECGSENVHEETSPGTHAVKGRKVEVTADQHFACDDCGEWSYPGELAGRLQEQIAAGLRKLDGLASLDELKAARLTYGFTQTEMDTLLGVGEKSWVRWERGRVPPSPAVDKVIRRFLDEPEFVNALMNQHGVENRTAREVIETAVRSARAYAANVARETMPSMPSEVADELAEVMVSVYRKQVGQILRADAAAPGDDWPSIVKRHTVRFPVDVDAIARDLGIKVLRDPNLGMNISGKIQRDQRLGGSSGFVMFINAQEPTVRQRFTVAHEVAHFCLHRDRIGDGIVENALFRGPFTDPQEREANRRAAETLIPEDLLRKEHATTRRISALALRFGTSEETMRIRCEGLGLA